MSEKLMTLSNIYDGSFCENSKTVLGSLQFCREASLQMFDSVLNRLLTAALTVRSSQIEFPQLWISPHFV